MRSLRFALCSVALASVVGLAACGSDDDGIGATTTAASSTAESTAAPTTAAAASTPSADSLTLEGVTWTLSDETDLGVDLAGVDVTARFLEGRVAGNSGCNQYAGTYVLSGEKLTISPNVAGTMMACPAPQSAVEAAFLKALPTVASSTIDGDTLTLEDKSGAAVLVFEHVAGDQLLAGDWTVTMLRTESAVSFPGRGLGADDDVR
ncbi:MAG: META domain-containing protein [Ilumatobacteraceae bacterium]